MAQTYAVETGFQIKVRNDGLGSQIKVGDDSSWEEEEQSSLDSHSDSGVAGLMRGWRKSMRFAGT